ncbi:MAG: hypothetical protein IJY36_06660 [Coprobacter sp.]|nr:hypothetical protein [Coprobacter sp.]
MDTARESLVKAIADMLCEAVEYAKANTAFSLTDMYVDFKPEDLQLSFYDDSEALLVQTTLHAYDEAAQGENIADLLREALDDKRVEEVFSSLESLTPVSVILLSDDGDTITELKTFDNDVLVLEDDFLKKVGDELDEFFENLMADVK